MLYIMLMIITIILSGFVPKEYSPQWNVILGLATGVLGVISTWTICVKVNAKSGFAERLWRNKPFLFSIGLGATFSLAVGTAILSQLPFDFSVSGFGYFFENSKLPFALLTGGIAAAGFVASIHRSEQTSKQIEQTDFSQRLVTYQYQEDEFHKLFNDTEKNEINVNSLFLELFYHPANSRSSKINLSFFQDIEKSFFKKIDWEPAEDEETRSLIEKIGGIERLTLSNIIEKNIPYEMLLKLKEHQKKIVNQCRIQNEERRKKINKEIYSKFINIQNLTICLKEEKRSSVVSEDDIFKRATNHLKSALKKIKESKLIAYSSRDEISKMEDSLKKILDCNMNVEREIEFGKIEQHSDFIFAQKTLKNLSIKSNKIKSEIEKSEKTIFKLKEENDKKYNNQLVYAPPFSNIDIITTIDNLPKENVDVFYSFKKVEEEVEKISSQFKEKRSKYTELEGNTEFEDHINDIDLLLEELKESIAKELKEFKTKIISSTFYLFLTKDDLRFYDFSYDLSPWCSSR